MGAIYDPKQEGWKVVERDGATEVTSHLLLPVEEGGGTRLSITRIAPGGVFGPHIDEYAHVFYVLEGEGQVMVGKNRQEIRPGLVIRTDIREPHGLWAGPDGPLTLLTANIYP